MTRHDSRDSFLARNLVTLCLGCEPKARVAIGKMDLLIFTLRGMDCILEMEFITHNNVFIERHNRILRIPSKNGVVRMRAHEVLNVGGLTIHFMLGIFLEKECMGGYGMLCVMRVLDEFEPKEATNLLSFPKCIKQILDELLDVMCKELPDELPPRKQIFHAIEVMLGVTPFAKAPYQLKELKVQLEEFLAKGYIKPSK